MGKKTLQYVDTLVPAMPMHYCAVTCNASVMLCCYLQHYCVTVESPVITEYYCAVTCSDSVCFLAEDAGARRICCMLFRAKTLRAAVSVAPHCRKTCSEPGKLQLLCGLIVMMVDLLEAYALMCIQQHSRDCPVFCSLMQCMLSLVNMSRKLKSVNLLCGCVDTPLFFGSHQTTECNAFQGAKKLLLCQ